MRTGVFLDYSGGFREAVEHIVVLEGAGVNIALVAEAYSFDAVSQLGYLAAKTSTIELGSGVFPIYTRTPSLLAMTAAGLGYACWWLKVYASAKCAYIVWHHSVREF